MRKRHSIRLRTAWYDKYAELLHNFRCLYRLQRQMYGRLDAARIAFDVTIRNPPF